MTLFDFDFFFFLLHYCSWKQCLQEVMGNSTIYALHVSLVKLIVKAEFNFIQILLFYHVFASMQIAIL